MSNAEEVSDADAEHAEVDGGRESSASFFASETNRALLGGSAAACIVASVVLVVVLKRRAARRRSLLPQAVSVPLDGVIAAVKLTGGQRPVADNYYLMMNKMQRQ
jgi:hypothetical protein